MQSAFEIAHDSFGNLLTEGQHENSRTQNKPEHHKNSSNKIGEIKEYINKIISIEFGYLNVVKTINPMCLMCFRFKFNKSNETSTQKNTKYKKIQKP